MLESSKVYSFHFIDCPLEALQEACQLFEKEREQWKRERLKLLEGLEIENKRIEALETENKQLRDQLALNSHNSSKPPSCDAMRIIYVNSLGPLNKKRPAGLRR